MVEFNDGKDHNALRTIGEVSEALDIKPHVLRYWEQQFALLKPMKRSGGRRYYRPSDVEMVEAINRLVNQEGYTLKGAEAVLRAAGASGSDRRTANDRRSADRRADAGEGHARRAGDTDPVQAPKPDYSEAIAKLKTLRDRLARAIEA